MPLDPTRRNDAPRDYYDYDNPQAQPTVAGPPAPPGRSSGPRAADDAPDPLAGRSHGRASAEFVRRSVAASTAAGSTPRSASSASHAADGVIYLGMNGTSGQNVHEARFLAQSVRQGTEVDVIGHGEKDAKLGPDQVRIQGPDGASATADLATDEGRQAFVSSLRLPPERAAAVAKVLADGEQGGRDELAGLASVLARGERGEAMPGRLVLSGHCYGSNLYDGNDKPGATNLGGLMLDSVKSLAQALPGGAAHIQDVMFSACSTGYDAGHLEAGRTALSSWKESFPNLKTAWGYGGPKNWHSPSGGLAMQHVADWEKVSRGAVDHLPAHAQRVSTWSERDGYRMGTDK
jgi:hypothetical protein